MIILFIQVLVNSTPNKNVSNYFFLIFTIPKYKHINYLITFVLYLGTYNLCYHYKKYRK